MTALVFQPGDRVIIQPRGRHVWRVVRRGRPRSGDHEPVYLLRSTTGFHLRTAFASSLVPAPAAREPRAS